MVVYLFFLQSELDVSFSVSEIHLSISFLCTFQFMLSSWHWLSNSEDNAEVSQILHLQ